MGQRAARQKEWSEGNDKVTGREHAMRSVHQSVANEIVELRAYIEYVASLAVRTDPNSSVVYTVSIGGSDLIKQPKKIDDSTIYVCFSDALTEDVGVWKTVHVSKKYRNDRRSARIFKMMPHLIFPDAETTAYVDASILITGSVSEFIMLHCEGSSLSMFMHPGRRCAYKEAQACIEQNKDDAGLLSSQMESYRAEGFPENYGLIAGGVIICRRSDDELPGLLNDWVVELDKFSLRDQVSFPYVAWRRKFNFNAVKLDIYDNNYFCVFPHWNARSPSERSLYRLQVLREHLGRVARRLLRRVGLAPRLGGEGA